MKKRMKSVLLAAATLCAALTIFSSTATAETTQCTAITTIPITITTQGIYCLNGNLSGNLATGSAITIATNNVTIDFNGYKLGNLAAGAGTLANGIFADQKKNITIRNGTIRGFLRGIWLEDTSPYSNSSGHLVEDVRFDGNTYMGIWVKGAGSIIRKNQVVKTGGSTETNTTYGYAYGIITYGPGVRVSGNDIIDITSSFAYALSVSFGVGTVVAGNRISGISAVGNGRGINLNLSHNATVSDNRIAGVPDDGIYFNASDGIYMNNTVSGSTTPFTGGSPAAGTNFNN